MLLDGKVAIVYGGAGAIGSAVARLEDLAHAAAFLASDRAPTMTATEVNITGGAVVD